VRLRSRNLLGNLRRDFDYSGLRFHPSQALGWGDLAFKHFMGATRRSDSVTVDKFVGWIKS